MTRVPDEPQSFSPEPDGDALLGDLRRQLEAVKARMAEDRLQAQAVGLSSTGETDSAEPSV
jgi:hypothetical protein